MCAEDEFDPRKSIVQDGGVIVFTAVVTSDDGVLLGRRGSGNKTGDGEGSSDFLGEVHGDR